MSYTGEHVASCASCSGEASLFTRILTRTSW